MKESLHCPPYRRNGVDAQYVPCCVLPRLFSSKPWPEGSLCVEEAGCWRDGPQGYSKQTLPAKRGTEGVKISPRLTTRHCLARIVSIRSSLYEYERTSLVQVQGLVRASFLRACRYVRVCTCTSLYEPLSELDLSSFVRVRSCDYKLVQHILVRAQACT